MKSPTRLVGFICPIKKVGLILAVPEILDLKKYSIKKVVLKKSYQKGRVNFVPGRKFLKFDLV